jgi:D-hexose-6-phosphate mutarotase
MTKDITLNKEKNGLTFLEVNNPYAKATISLYGAQVLSYIPHEEKDLLWLSEKSAFEIGKAIRGGIPLCFPWFGPHAQDKNKAQHGFARTSTWELSSSETLDNGATYILLSLQQNADTLALWPYLFNAQLHITISQYLEVKLTVTNTDNRSFNYSDALHTYFKVDDVTNISVEGLYNAGYFNGFGMELIKQETALLLFNGEENRRYVNHTGDCIINDKGNKRNIKVSKSGSKVTVVWNPWETTASKMTDIEEGGYKKFICVEAANAYEGIDIIHLESGESCSITSTIELLKK